MNHYGFMPGIPYTHPQSPRSLDKPQPHLPQSQALPPTSQNPTPGTQNEPQNLKIKQEVPDNQETALPPSHLSLPPYAQGGISGGIPHSQSLPPTAPQGAFPPSSSIPSQVSGFHSSVSSSSSSSQNANLPPSNGGYASSSLNPLPPTSISDPLQSLKDVKVPGYGMPTSAPQQSTGGSGERPSSGPAVENIKKEPEFMGAGGRPATASPARPPVEKSPALKSGTPTQSGVSQTPPLRQTSKLFCLFMFCLRVPSMK